MQRTLVKFCSIAKGKQSQTGMAFIGKRIIELKNFTITFSL